MSFKAHLACKGLGYVDVTIRYLKEVKKYELEADAELNERADSLRAEANSTYEATKLVVL